MSLSWVWIPTGLGSGYNLLGPAKAKLALLGEVFEQVHEGLGPLLMHLDELTFTSITVTLFGVWHGPLTLDEEATSWRPTPSLPMLLGC